MRNSENGFIQINGRMKTDTNFAHSVHSFAFAPLCRVYSRSKQLEINNVQADQRTPIKKQLLLLIALGGIISGCNTSPNGTITSTIDRQVFGGTDFYDTYFRQRQESLGLSDLQNGFDSLQLRVWWHFSFSDSADVFVIKKEPTEKWSASRMRFPIYSESESFGSRTLTSNNGEEIWGKLNRLGIVEYNGMDSVTLGSYTDGEIAVIEIATKSSYQFCSSQSSLAYTSENDALEIKTATAFLKCLFSGMEFPEEAAR